MGERPMLPSECGARMWRNIDHDQLVTTEGPNPQFAIQQQDYQAAVDVAHGDKPAPVRHPESGKFVGS